MINKFRRLMRGFAWWILGNVKPLHDEVDEAIRGAFRDVGLNADDYCDEYDLVRSGKLYAIITYSAQRIGNPLVTVKDLKEFLE